MTYRIDSLFRARARVHAEMVQAAKAGTLTRALIDRLNEINEELADLGVIPTLPA